MKITFHISVKLSTGIQNPTYDLKCFVFNELEQNFEFAINLQEKRSPFLAKGDKIAWISN